MRYYPLGQTYTPREIISRAYGTGSALAHDKTLEHGRLKRNGRVAYELSTGKLFGHTWYTVIFATIDLNGKATRLPEHSGSFSTEKEVLAWIDLVDAGFGQVS